MRILIAEDHPDIGLVMETLVHAAGHDVCLAKDGYEAIRLATEQSFAAALLDIKMPGIDGYETASRLRRRLSTRFPIFAVTGSPIDDGRACASGIDGVFSKPFDTVKLSALLKYLFAQSE